jgi:hypothetical protein
MPDLDFSACKFGSRTDYPLWTRVAQPPDVVDLTRPRPIYFSTHPSA